MDNEDPKVVKSKTDSEKTDPRRDKPNNDTAEPNRAIDLRDKDDPRWM
jgi:hypothetical protein